MSKPPTLAQLVRRVRSGVLRVEVETCDGRAIGTGFLIGPRLVATVQHVVDGAVAVTFKRQGKLVGSGAVIGSDASTDVALLRTDAPLDGYRFRLEPRTPQLGEDVAALGFPLGLPLSLSRGTASGSDRTVKIEGIRRRGLIQTDAALNPGNSGGPLLEVSSGRVIGLVDLRTEGAPGIGFAVSAKTAKPLLDAWRLAPQREPAADCVLPGMNQPSASSSASGNGGGGTQGSVRTFSGRFFDVSYPAAWTVAAADANKGSYYDTTIKSPGSDTTLVRVDVTPHQTKDPQSAAREVQSYLVKQAGYRELAFGGTQFVGQPAFRWEFTVPEHGTTLHKIDVFFLSGGQGYAILTQAPEGRWSIEQATLDAVAQTLTPK